MDIQGFLIECWKAVELYNAGKISSKLWEQLEVLKDAIRPQDYNRPNAEAMRNIISALKKMFKGDRYHELYFLRKKIGSPDVNPMLQSFRWALISLLYATLGESKKSKAAWTISGKLTVKEPCYSIGNIAWALAELHTSDSSTPSLFNIDYGSVYLAALFLDPLLAAEGVVRYPFKVSWIANSLMRAIAVAEYLESEGQVHTLLDRYKNEYLKDSTDPIPTSAIIASDIGTAQQASCAAYFTTCKASHLDILDNMEKTDQARLRFITGKSLLANTEPSSYCSLFYVLRRWNSFTPIVPNLEQRQRIYRGGGYFIWHENTGTVVDPGFRFIRNFADAGGRVADIDNIVITHAHNDHTADLESIFTVLYQHNATIKNTLKEIGAYLPGLQVAYEEFLLGNPNATDAAKLQFLGTMIPTGQDSQDIKTLKGDWSELRSLLTDNDIPGDYEITLAGIVTTRQDRAIMEMCLPKGDTLQITIDPETRYNVIASTPEDILKEAGHAKKKVTVYANLGTMRKFNAIIDPDSQYIDYIGDVFVIHPGQTYTLTKETDNSNGLTMIVHKAYHNEVVTKNYATGLEFVFSNLAPNTKGERTKRVIITSDTSLAWTFKPDPNKNPPPADAVSPDYTDRQNLQFTNNEVFKNYTPKPDLLLPHIGSIKDYEVSPPSYNPGNFIYKNHLGIIGITQVISRIQPTVALITEFGEEMTKIIEQSVNMIRLGVQAMNTLTPATTPEHTPKPTNILPADIGLVFLLNDNEYHSAITWNADTAVTTWPFDGKGKPKGQAGIDPVNLDVTYSTVQPEAGADYKTFPVAYKDKTKQ